MLHELLLALGGYPGSIFLVNKKNEIKLVPNLPFISSAEEHLLNRICQLGSHFYQFQDFIQAHNKCPVVAKENPDNGLRHGLYLKAFCDGLEKVLEPYRVRLLELEKELMADPYLTAQYIQQKLDEFHHLFRTLAVVIEQIKVQKAHGCHILDVLHRNGLKGVPIVKAALLKIMHYCHGVMYKQLSSWMIHGVLMDRHNEFFIQNEAPEPTPAKTQVDDDELGLGGVTGRQLQQLFHMTDDIPTIDAIPKEFSIKAEMLPIYIPLPVADKILFAGESVNMFSHKRTSVSINKHGSILGKNEARFSADIHRLSQENEFSEREFEKVIDQIRTCVAERLWKLVVEESSLFGQLKIIKDFYLLGRGELYLAFIDKTDHLLNHPPLSTTEHAVNAAFQQAARNVLFEDDSLIQRFQLTIKSKPLPRRSVRSDNSHTESPSDIGWNQLGLMYSVEWPLHILFTTGTLEKYSQIFHFLLALKRVQLELQNCWALQMSKKKSKNREHATEKWLLRNHMAFLVDNIQYYLQVDVIESQYSILLQKIQETRDFEEIRHAHDRFLTNLLAHSFLHMKPIERCINQILDICHQFCALICQPDVIQSEREAEILENLTKNFRLQSSYLFTILSSVRNHQTSPHLVQLLLRIDYNKFYSTSGGQLGSFCDPSSSRPPSIPSRQASMSSTSSSSRK